MTQSKVSRTGASPFPAREIEQEFARIRQLAKEGKGQDAWKAANNLYGNYPNASTPNFAIALILVENDQKADAMQYAEAAVKFAPDNVRNLVFLGKLYVDLGMIEFAPPILHKAFALDSTVYQAPWALAAYYLKAGQGARALPYFEMALRAAPVSAKVGIRSNRADCLRALGRVEETENEYRTLFDVPNHRIHAITGAALLRKNDQTSDYARKIEALLLKEGLTTQDRSSLLLCLGRLHENGRDYDGAFANYEKSRKLLVSRFRAEEYIGQVNSSLTTLKRDVFEKFRSFGHESGKPVFVVGMPRSGTTLTEQILASHSEVEGVGELPRMSNLAEGLSARNGMQEVLDKMREVGPAQWQEVPRQYLNLIDALAPNVRHTVDKMPHNFLWLGFIHLCFPNARIIHCKRNPIDNFISAFQNQMNAAHGYSYDQVAYGEYYVRYLQLMDHWKSVFPDSIYESQYENLTANPEAEIRKLLEFLGLPWEEGCLKFNEREATVKTFSHLQVRAPISTASVARWKNFEKHLGPIISVLQGAKVRF